MSAVSRVVIFAPDVVPDGDVPASGPGIRAAEVAAALRAASHEVILAVPAGRGDVRWTPSTAAALAGSADAVILGQGHAELGRRLSRDAPHDLPIVVDCYAPGIIEHALLAPDARAFPAFRRRAAELLERGDLFLVANERQRLFTLGELAALGRIDPCTIDHPPLLEVGYGVPSVPPAGDPSVAAGVVPDGAPIAIWFGGVYPWFDAVTAIKGFALALERCPAAHLVIVGGRHPREHAPARELERARAEIARLSLEERVHEAPWLPYDRRADWYAAADCAICLQHDGVERELAHRTRLLDLIWGRLPIVCSQGDAVGDLVGRSGAGVTCPIGDDVAVGAALAELLSNSAPRASCRASADALADSLTWDKVVAPLATWLEAPRLARDRELERASWARAAAAVARAARERRVRR